MAENEDKSFNIGNHTQLFVDDYLIERMSGLHCVTHPVEKCSANPLVIPEFPFEKRYKAFFGWNVGSETGEWITNPIIFTGDELSINADAHAGSIKVANLDKNNSPIPGFEEVDCQAISEDHVHIPITWKDKKDLCSLKGREIRFRFIIENASIYSYAVV